MPENFGKSGLMITNGLIWAWALILWSGPLLASKAMLMPRKASIAINWGIFFLS